MTTAVVFVPHGDQSVRFAAQCLTYCDAKGYEVAGIVTGIWLAVVNMVCERQAGVVVVARAEHLDPLREPRIEVAGVAAEPQHRLPVAARRRRPHRL